MQRLKDFLLRGTTTLALLLLILVLTACSDSEPSTEMKVTIHAGSANGPYAALVEQMNALNSKCVDGAIDSRCLANFKIDPACNNGGSIQNLVRLGMSEAEGEDFKGKYDCERDQDGKKVNRPRGANDFGLVQNLFISKAVPSNCDADDLENNTCNDSSNHQFLDESFRPFDKLRIVLPMYYSRIQFIARGDLVSIENDQIQQASSQSKVEELVDLQDKFVYLRGVNEIYGMEILDRHPSLRNNYKIFRQSDLDRENYARTADELSMNRQSLARILDYVNEVEGNAAQSNRLLACGIISAYVISGEMMDPGVELNIGNDTGPKPEACNETYMPKQLVIPDPIIDGMVSDYPYYQKLGPPSYWNVADTDKKSMPGIITYLVTTSDADTSLVSRFTSAVIKDWRNLMLVNRELVPIEDNVYKKPAPYHLGAEQALKDEELLGGGYLPTWAATLFALLILSVFWKTEDSYDRLGEIQKVNGSSLFNQAIFVILKFAFIIVGWIFVFMLVVDWIVESDAVMASSLNTDDQLSRFNYFEALLWMFTFVSSGYENNVFPISNGARFMVSAFAIAGVALPLYVLAKLWEQLREQRLRRAAGGEYPSLLGMAKDRFLQLFPWSRRNKGVLLLCGWNRKAPGLVYTLTCPDSPFQGMVNIVADMGVDSPISHWRFNKRRVRFYRGDASHRVQLERAETLRADTALILSDDSTGASSNSSGVLTALAIRKLKPNIAVSAEMALDRGDREFAKQHEISAISSKLLARHVLTIGCFDSHALDFMLDALSPDKHSEWYAKRVGDLRKKLHLPDSSEFQDYSQSLWPHGISIVGAYIDKPERGGGSRKTQDEFENVFSPDFENPHLDPLIPREGDLEREVFNKKLFDDDYLICAARHPLSFTYGFYMPTFGKKFQDQNLKALDHVLPDLLIEEASVLIIGHRIQAETLAGHMQSLSKNIETSIVDTAIEDKEILDEEIKQKINEGSFSHVLLLSSIPTSHSAEEHSRFSLQADSETILRANMIRLSTNISTQKHSPKIITEVNNTHSRQLARDADVTTVVPSSLLVERILARLVTERGRVAEMLTAMISMKDGTFLHSIKWSKEYEKEFGGLTYNAALNSWFKNGRILGILPAQSDHYRNDSDDFDWHFQMGPTSAGDTSVLSEGDVVVVLSYPKPSDSLIS